MRRSGCGRRCGEAKGSGRRGWQHSPAREPRSRLGLRTMGRFEWRRHAPAAPIPIPSPANCAGEGRPCRASHRPFRTICHPEPQAHRASPYIVPGGAKDLAADTYKPGRGSGHPCSGRDVGAFLHGPAHAPAALSPGPSPASGRGENSIQVRRGADACPWEPPPPGPHPPLRRGGGDQNCAPAGVEHVRVKPRAGRDSGPSRGFPLFQPRVYPPLVTGLAPRRGPRLRAAAAPRAEMRPRLDPTARTGSASGRVQCARASG